MQITFQVVSNFTKHVLLKCESQLNHTKYTLPQYKYQTTTEGKQGRLVVAHGPSVERCDLGIKSINSSKGIGYFHISVVAT